MIGSGSDRGEGRDARGGGRALGGPGIGVFGVRTRDAPHPSGASFSSPLARRNAICRERSDRIGGFFFTCDRGKGTRERRRVRGRDPSSLKALLETIVGTAAGGGGVSGRVFTTRRARDRRRGYRAPDPRGTRPPRAPRGACARRSRRTPSVAAAISVFSLGRGKRCGCFFRRAAGCGEIAARGREIERAREPGAARYERARSRGAREGRRGAEGASGSRDAASCAPVATAEG